MRVPTRKSEQSVKRPSNDPYITKNKAKELEEKLKRMVRNHPKLANEVKRLALDGDFSENAPYQLAKARLRGLNNRILRTKKQLNSAIIIKSNNKKGVEIGSTVEVEKEGKIKIYTILGSSETNPSQGIISYQSKLGSALLNKKVNDKITLKTSNKTISYTIKKINYLSDNKSSELAPLIS